MYQKAAAAGNSDAMLACYESSNEIMYLKTSAEMGNPTALVNYGIKMAEEGDSGDYFNPEYSYFSQNDEFVGQKLLCYI